MMGRFSRTPVCAGFHRTERGFRGNASILAIAMLLGSLGACTTVPGPGGFENSHWQEQFHRVFCTKAMVAARKCLMYLNHTGHPIEVSVRAEYHGSCGLDLYVAGIKVSRASVSGSDTVCNANAIVPNRLSYFASDDCTPMANPTIHWFELLPASMGDGIETKPSGVVPCD